MQLTRLSDVRELACRICGREAEGDVLVRVDRHHTVPIDGIRCRECGSLDLIRLGTGDSGDAAPSPSSADIDTYIESGVGIEAIAGLLATADAPGVRTMLAVNCGYGFSVHLAQQAFDWSARGIEPGPLAARGAKELGVRIDQAELAPALPHGPRYDLVVATDVLAHVQDPAAYVRDLTTHLAPLGRLVVTAPAAEIIDGPEPDTAVLAALVSGAHAVLFSEAGLELLLRAAGFGTVSVIRDADGLRALALVEDGIDPGKGFAEVRTLDLEQYYASSARSAPKGSALELAMVTRHYRALVNRSAWDEAATVRTRLLALVRRRYKLDLAAPSSVASGGPVSIPDVVGIVAYALGMHALLGESQLGEARNYFTLVLAAVHDQRSRGVVSGADTMVLQLRARHSLVLIAARTGSRQVHTLLRRLEQLDSPTEVEAAAVLALTELVAAGHLELGRELERRVGAAAGRLAASEDPDHAVVGLNGLLALALLDLQSARPQHAAGWLRLAQTVLTSIADRLPEAYVASLGNDLDRHLALAQTRQHEPEPRESPAAVAASELPERERVPGAVSVIMPVYNGARYLAQAIRSVVRQESPPLELIVVDDGSADDSVAIAELIDSEFPIIVVSQDNAGQSAARNAGALLARGEYLAFLDQDDEWRPNHLTLLVERMSSDRSIGWTFTDFDQVNSDGHTVTTHYVSEAGVQHPKRSLAAVIGADLMVLPSASLIRREAFEEVGGFDSRLVGYEDDDLFVRIYRAGWRHAFLPESTTRYRVHMSGSSNSLSFLRSRLIFMEKLMRTIPDNHNLNLFYSQDVIVPRFYQVTLADYSVAIATGDYDRAVEFANALRSITRLQGNTSRRRSLALDLLRRPATMRRIVGFLDRAPRAIRNSFNPALFSGYRNVMRASRFHPEFSDQTLDL